jgi:Zn-finger nucleic acid-binding protein
MAEEFKQHGYDKEADYFYKKNKELVERMRKKLDADRAHQAETAASNPHYMKCPKCAGDLREIDLLGVKVDQCTKCLGTYFDRGELELLIESPEPKGFLGGLRSLFKR